MVTIEQQAGNFIFEIKGMHKLWALKSQLSIPAAHIVTAYPNNDKFPAFFGIKFPGTHIPGIITAGTYIVKDGTIFCDVVSTAKSIVVELQDEHYKRLIIEVEDVDAAITLLTKK